MSSLKYAIENVFDNLIESLVTGLCLDSESPITKRSVKRKFDNIQNRQYMLCPINVSQRMYFNSLGIEIHPL